MITYLFSVCCVNNLAHQILRFISYFLLPWQFIYHIYMGSIWKLYAWSHKVEWNITTIFIRIIHRKYLNDQSHNRIYWVIHVWVIICLSLSFHFNTWLLRKWPFTNRIQGIHLLWFEMFCKKPVASSSRKLNVNGQWIPVGCMVKYMKTLVSQACILGQVNWLHHTEYCGMQLLIPAWENCFWCESLDIRFR